MAITEYLPVISQIENALVARLKRGLGQLAYEVRSYAGELDSNKLGVFQLPLVLVSYGGSRFDGKGSTSKGIRFESQDTFVVIVIVRSLRSELAARQGGVTKREVGANQLISAVKRLLINQTLDRTVKPIRPMRVQTLLNNAEIGAQLLTAYALEFEVRYDQDSWLEDGRFPEPTDDPTHPDYLFNHYQADLSEPYPDLLGIDGKLFDPTNRAEQPFSVELQEKK